MSKCNTEETICVSMLYKMILIRVFEDTVEKYKNERMIYGMAHCCNGQEAVAVGVCAALEQGDYIISNHRPHGHAIAKGVKLKRIMAEIFGKATGSNSGKGGSMHIHDESCGLITSTGIVGSGIPVACGVAFAIKYKQERKISCVFFGDGAANEGVFYECLNLAAVWKLPIIFVLEDNGLAVTTATRTTSACTDYTKLASVYGIKTLSVNGQDARAVYNATLIATEYVRGNGLPVLIQAKTIRFHEHAEGEWYLRMRKTNYRDINLLEQDKQNNCPIKIFSTVLQDEGVISETEIQEMYKRAEEEVQKSVEYAISSPVPKSESAFENVYS